MNTSPYGETRFCCQGTLKFLFPLTVTFKKSFTDPELEFYPSLMYLFIVNVQPWVQMKEQLVSGSLDSSSDSSTECLSMTK